VRENSRPMIYSLAPALLCAAALVALCEPLLTMGTMMIDACAVAIGQCVLLCRVLRRLAARVRLVAATPRTGSERTGQMRRTWSCLSWLQRVSHNTPHAHTQSHRWHLLSALRSCWSNYLDHRLSSQMARATGLRSSPHSPPAAPRTACGACQNG
jgi:hypothetical protein